MHASAFTRQYIHACQAPCQSQEIRIDLHEAPDPWASWFIVFKAAVFMTDDILTSCIRKITAFNQISRNNLLTLNFYFSP